MKFDQRVKIQKYFGDFGGDYSERDTVAPEKKLRAEHLEKLLASEEFSDKFDSFLKQILPLEINIQAYTLKNGRTLYTAPALTRYYILAGYLAIAAFDGRDKAVLGTYSDEMVLAFAQACKKLGFGARVCLSRAQTQKKALIDRLRELDADMDNTTCTELFDTPYSYVNFDDAMGYSIIPMEANYGPYPQASLTGMLAGLYGADLKKALGGKLPGCVAVAIETGTEAVGVLPVFAGTGCTLATVEATVAKEFHLEDSGAYTLSTRSADYDQPDTTICPELAYWWHMAKVARLGCDRIFPVDVTPYQDVPVGAKTARAAALAFEMLGCSDLLVVEENV